MSLFCRLLFTQHLRQLGETRAMLLKVVPGQTQMALRQHRFIRHIAVLSGYQPNTDLHLPNKSRLCKQQISSINQCVRHYAKKTKKEKKGKSSGPKVELSDEEMQGVIDMNGYRTSLQQVLDHQREEFIHHLSLRTTAGVFDSIKAQTADGSFPINQLGQIAQKSPSLIMINMSASPQYLPAVKDAIINSGMNVNPQQEANTLFVALPKVTKEHRENLAKSAKTICDTTKEKLRDVHNKQSKKLKQAKSTQSEDLLKQVQELILSEMHVYTEKAESMTKVKQQELLGQ